MLVKANVSFAGLITMFGGEERNITDEQVVKDLLDCGYVTPLSDYAGAKSGTEQEADAETESDTEQESNRNAETGQESAEDEDKRTSKRSH